MRPGVILRLEGEKEPEGLEAVARGWYDGVSGQHLQALMTQLLQQHWGVAGGQEEKPVARQRNETHDVHWPAWTSRRPST